MVHKLILLPILLLAGCATAPKVVDLNTPPGQVHVGYETAKVERGVDIGLGFLSPLIGEIPVLSQIIDALNVKIKWYEPVFVPKFKGQGDQNEKIGTNNGLRALVPTKLPGVVAGEHSPGS